MRSASIILFLNNPKISEHNLFTQLSVKMKILINKIMLCLLGTATMLGMTTEVISAPKKLLVVTVTKGFRHGSIPTAEKVLG